ncbi:endonuclease domain-containing protein [Qipengyuania sp. DSG2-2]|uniref:endonuclease domain-containing protein n=1 Tax=Qipengyuania sp. DGS2-2 TaxID=3349631 RepID=UPI0036D332F7
MPRPRRPRNIAKARKLRSEASLPERLLWRELRQQQDIKFRRQHSIEPYVLDFYCASLKLCIEIDGIAHDMGDKPQRDVERDAKLLESGIETLRFTASEVLADPGGVADSIVRLCEARKPLRPEA